MAPVGRQVLSGVRAGPCCLPSALCGMVRRVAILRAAVSTIHPHAFRIGVHCCHVRVLVAV